MAKNNGGFLLGALVGGIAGAAAALFLTSEKGRKWLAEWSNDETWEPVKTTAAEWIETAKEKTKEIASFIPLKSTTAPAGGENDGEEAKEATIPIPPSAGPADRETLQKLLEEAEAALDDAEQSITSRKETE
ncbi:YtxH domain-containing protein [Geobacillus zalihae]|uniref:YtxH domain-containing protein n=1 Tax=Geobacillus zalihae TaxID=213419 RepID=UPI001681874A|nr:YtxH domain-containing protein [Geobacillus zalihae]QNU25975.1 YtxH domain-containing protein [Geobacillus zalihae]